MIFAPEIAALVTGAGSGIGAATAVRLAADGVQRFALVDRNAEGLTAVAAKLPGEVLTFVQDVTDEDAWNVAESAIRMRFGGLDLAIASAGVASSGALVDLAYEEWRRILAVNLDGVFLTLRASMRLLRDEGSAVLVASAAGLKAEPGIAAYAASKAGVIQLARVAAKEGAVKRIRVNAIAPGGVETPLWYGMPVFEALVARKGSKHAAFDAMAAMATPLGRYATADEIANQIVFLLSPAAATITGAVLSSDGGYTL